MSTVTQADLTVLGELRAAFRDRWWIEIGTGLCRWEARRHGLVGAREERGGMVAFQAETPEILRDLIAGVEALERRITMRYGTSTAPRQGAA
ncbi:hypothetical protein GCM10009678_40240 [Actinomadura kijaniata]|uniref:Uncharacterized protein n=1 Tax=Actinomadura namibiensis TaxID=182080 RepID=A0A7W3LUK1_ACTNM|nr:hypothetical protein [Actinomadura namibiensis]MBA8954482.1 hypothetical protein [Actinomadura namibiensis]